MKINWLTSIFILFISALSMSACGSSRGAPAESSLPDSPMERAAIEGLHTSYRESTMWQIKDPIVLGVTPVAPTASVLEAHDPKEIYCVCVEYLARYKVEWTTTEPSPWERTVRNVTVMKTQGDMYLAVEPMNLCSAYCQ